MLDFLYTVAFEIPQLAIFAVIYNGLLTLIPLGFVKLSFLCKTESREYELNK